MQRSALAWELEKKRDRKRFCGVRRRTSCRLYKNIIVPLFEQGVATLKTKINVFVNISNRPPQTPRVRHNVFYQKQKFCLLFFTGCIILLKHRCRCDGMVDVVDSKSTAGDSVPVRVRPPAPNKYNPNRISPLGMGSDYLFISKHMSKLVS